MSRVVPSQVKEFIEQVFHPEKLGPQIPSQDATKLAALVTLSEKLPPELLTLNAADFSAYTMALETIRHQLSLWHHRPDPPTLPHVMGRNAVIVIYEALRLCPDEMPSPDTGTLSFIDDEPLRESIRMDIGAANRDLVDHEYKGATVLAGAAVEALLLWVIQKQDPNIVREGVSRLRTRKVLHRDLNPNAEFWEMIELIEVAAELDLIKGETAQQARLGKNFRNLIHPGRAVRIGQACDRGTALSGLAAVEHIARDLAP